MSSIFALALTDAVDARNNRLDQMGRSTMIGIAVESTCAAIVVLCNDPTRIPDFWRDVVICSMTIA